MTRRFTTTTASVLLAGLIVAGCNGDNGDEDPTGQANPANSSPTAAEAPATPTSVPEPPTPEPPGTHEPPATEEPVDDEAAVVAKVEEYWAVIDEAWFALKEPTQESLDEARSRWYEVAGGSHALRAREPEWSRGLSTQVVQEGVHVVEIQSVSWLAEDEAQVTICLDRSGITHTSPFEEYTVPWEHDRTEVVLMVEHFDNTWWVMEDHEGVESC